MGLNIVSEVNSLQQAKQGNITAISSLMNRLLKSQCMMAAVDQEENCLHILIESDLRSLDDDLRIPNRTVLVAMLKKWFVSLEVQKVSSLHISWQQTGQDAPAWTELVQIDPPAMIALETDSNDETMLQDNMRDGSVPTQPQLNHGTSDAVNSLDGSVVLSEPPHLTEPAVTIAPSQLEPEIAARNESFDDIFGNDPIGSIGASDNELLQLALQPLPDLPLPEVVPSPEATEIFMLMDVPTNVPTTPAATIVKPKVEPNVLTTNPAQAASMDSQANLSIIDPAAAETGNIMNQASESPAAGNSRNWFHTNSFLLQFGQYLVICGLIIGLVQGLHSTLRPAKPDKAVRPTAAMQVVSTDSVADNSGAAGQSGAPKQNLVQQK